LTSNSRSTGTCPGEKTRTRITHGEILANGAFLDLVALTDRDGLGLLFSDGKTLFSAEQIDYHGVLYQAPKLDASIRQAITFPDGAVEYGTIAKLFMKISSIYRQHAGLPEDLAAFATCWTLSSWVPELTLIPITLCVIGAPMLQVCKLFRLFGALCRRALLVAELSRGLPFFLYPTFMINDPKLSGKACAFWRAASCRGMFVAGAGSTVCELGCSKAVLLQPEDSPDAWGEEAMHLVLPHAEFPPLSAPLLANIAAQLQPQLEMFRLRLLRGMDQFVSNSHPLSKFELARNLGACIPEDAEIVRILTPLFESHQQDLLLGRARDPRVAIVEAVWIPSHKPGKMSPTEVTERVNAIVNSRGEICQYNAWEIGWMLRKLALHTRRNRDSKVLQFSSETRQRVHQLAQEFGLQLPTVKDCPDCQASQVIDNKSVE
jgi:hypothetical protein